MKILLLGAKGQVGWELRRSLAQLGPVIATARDDSADLRLDICATAQLAEALDRTAPDLIVNATAYTAVDKAESEADLARQINTAVPALLGDWAARHGALVLHYSTDYVFDGSKADAYVEDDATNPISVYGSSKLAGDQALLATEAAAIILRVSWVYGLRGHNFLLTMRRLMQERDQLRIVDDQIGAPTWSRSIAQATATLLARLPRDPAARMTLRGVYHLAPSGSTSWFGFASAIRDHLGLDCELSPIPTSQYPTPARRPKNSRLDSTRLCNSFDLYMPNWEHDLALCLQD